MDTIREKNIKRLAGLIEEQEFNKCNNCRDVSADCRECEAEYLLDAGYLPVELVELEALGDEELDKHNIVTLTQDDRDELESMATIGLDPHDEDSDTEYGRRLDYLYDLRVKQKVSQATIRHNQKGQLYRVRE